VDYRILETNPAFGRMTGFADAAGRTSLELNPDAEPYWFETLGRVAKTGEDARFESYAEALDRWFDVYASRVGGEGSRRVAIVFANTTERKRAEEELRKSQEALRKSEEFHRFAVEAGRIGTWDLDLQTEECLISPKMADLMGFSPDQTSVPGAQWRESIVPDDRTLMASALTASIESDAPFDLEFRIALKDGTERWLYSRGGVTRDASGKALRVHGASIDVTERKRTEEKLRESEERLRRAIGIETVGVIFFKVDGSITDSNDAFLQMSGYSRADLEQGKVRWDVMTPPEWMPHSLKAVEEFESTGRTKPYEKEFVRKDGSRWWALFAATRLDEEEGVEFIIDITESKRAEEALRESDERVRLATEAAQMYTWEVDVATQEVKLSPNAEQVLGFSPPLRFAESIPMMHPEDRDAVIAMYQRALRGEEKLYIEYRVVNPENGEIVWLRAQGLLIGSRHNDAPRFVGVAQNITERKWVEEERRQARSAALRADVSTAFSESGTLRGVLRHCAECMVRHLDAAFARIWTLKEEENVLELQASAGMYTHLDGPHSRVPVGELKIGLIAQERQPHLTNAVTSDPRVSDREWAKREGMVAFAGHPLIVENRVVGVMAMFARQALTEDTAEALASVADTIAQGIERRRAEEQLRHQAFHDILTGLPNRRLFVDRLEQALRRTRRTRGRKVAVLFMDLDNFKVINDSLGHELGDKLLVAMAERLRTCLRPEDTLARFGGDEFTVLLEEVANPEDAVRVAKRIVERFRGPFVLDGKEFFVTASIGIAMGTAGKKNPEELLRDADTAMYRAKAEGMDYRVFDPQMYLWVVNRLELENDLRRAIEAEEFILHYQPIVNTESGEARGVEALVRWNNPERGLLNPQEFVPQAEESGLVIPMDEQVLEEACRQAKEWQEEHPRIPPVLMNVNLSARQLRRPDLATAVEEVLQRTGFEATCLSLDITETVYIKVLDGNTAALDELKRMGVKIAIDDFGVGYSSLSYLKRLPADVLKIDKSFIKGLGEDVEDTAIVRMAIELAHTFGMEVVAEGVEDRTQVALLREIGCDMAQGFFFSEPLPSEEAAEFLMEERIL
jgi:diguanylate cyclase (GGDEF)-like protein/PAS domain S-box-containing protein